MPETKPSSKKKFVKDRKPFAKLPIGELKLYLAVFKDAVTGDYCFHKFGHTSFHDAEDRFKYEPEQYKKWDIKILKTVWGPEEDILKLELEYQKRYPKTFWIEEKIGGVTEITKLKFDDVQKVISEFSLLGEKYYFMREKQRALKRQEYNLNG
jgi:hypothetical protein